MFQPRVVLHGTFNDVDVEVPANDVSLDIEVIDSIATVTSEVTFANAVGGLVYALYLQCFMDDRSTLLGFSCKVGETNLEMRVEKVPEEKEHHEPRMTSGLDITPLMISIIPGSLKQGERLEAKFTYVTRLSYNEGEFELCVPTLKPTSTHPLNVSKFQLTFSMSRVIQDAMSPAHQLSYDSIGERVGTADVTVDPSKPFEDFVLTITVENPEKPLVTIQEDDETGNKAILVTWDPGMHAFGEPLSEVYFCIDRSGSMDNGRLAKCAVKLPNGRLPSCSGFGSSSEFVFPKPVEINDSNFELVWQAIEPWVGDLGQTNVKGVFEKILELPLTNSGYVRHVIVLTDGEVENVDSVTAFAARHAHTTVFSAIQLGKPNIEYFSRALARAGGGECVIVSDDSSETLAERAKELLASILCPYIADVSLKFENIIEDYAPFLPRPIKQGEALIVAGVVRGEVTMGALTVAGQSSRGPYSHRIAINNSMTTTGVSLHKYAASLIARDIEKDQSSFPPQGYVFLESREQALADKLSELSIWNNISSRESTFACVVEDFSMDAKTVPSDYRFVYAKVEKEEKDKSQNSSAGNFWATFGFNSDTALDKMLDTGEFTLEDLLSEDDFFSEAQASNENLVRYFHKPHAVKRIFSYVASPSVSKDHPNWQRIYLCTEVLVLPVWDEILDHIYSSGSQCMELLLTTLAQPNIDDQRIFRICRVLAAFMGFDIDRLIDYLKSQKTFVVDIIRNIGVSFVIDFLKALLKPENGPKRADILSLLFAGGLFEEAIKCLGPAQPAEVQDNASEVIVTLVNASKDFSLQERPFETKVTIDRIFEIMFDQDGKSTKSYLRGLDVLSTIIGSLQSPPKSSPDDKGPPPAHPTLLLIGAHLADFKSVITAPNRSRIGTFGEIVVAGEPAVSTIRFLLALIRPRSLEIDQKMIELDLITASMELFIRSRLNNLLHAAVEQLLTHILSTYREDPSLKMSLFTKTDLPRRVAEGMRATKAKTEQGYNMGHCAWGGHLYRVGVAMLAERFNPAIDTLIKEHPIWKEYENEFTQEQELYAGWSNAPPKRL